MEAKKPPIDTGKKCFVQCAESVIKEGQCECHNRIEDDKKIGRHIDYIIKALEKIKQQGGDAGVIPCPKCGKDLAYTISKYNGHVWGSCQTEGCLRWAQ